VIGRINLGTVVEVVETSNNKPQEQPTIMDTVSSGRILFGAFELDLSTGELRSIEAPDPNKVVLREQVFQVLRLLLEREARLSPARKSRAGCGQMIRSSISITASMRRLKPYAAR